MGFISSLFPLLFINVVQVSSNNRECEEQNRTRHDLISQHVSCDTNSLKACTSRYRLTDNVHVMPIASTTLLPSREHSFCQYLCLGLLSRSSTPLESSRFLGHVSDTKTHPITPPHTKRNSALPLTLPHFRVMCHLVRNTYAGCVECSFHHHPLLLASLGTSFLHLLCDGVNDSIAPHCTHL